MSKRFLSKEEIRIIRIALVHHAQNIRTEASGMFTNKLEQYQKITPYEYDSMIKDLQNTNALYKELGEDNITIIIESNKDMIDIPSQEIRRHKCPDDCGAELNLAAFESDYNDGNTEIK